MINLGANKRMACLVSHRLLAGGSPVVAIASKPRSRFPIHPGDCAIRITRVSDEGFCVCKDL